MHPAAAGFSELIRRSAPEIPEATEDRRGLELALRKRADHTRAYFDQLAGKFGRSYCPGRSWKGLTEALLLLKILPDYDRHCQHPGGTLLPHFLGLYTVTVDGRDIWVVVQANVFASGLPIFERYDLKGAWSGRSASARELAKGPRAVLKDRDFVSRGRALACSSEGTPCAAVPKSPPLGLPPANLPASHPTRRPARPLAPSARPGHRSRWSLPQGDWPSAGPDPPPQSRSPARQPGAAPQACDRTPPPSRPADASAPPSDRAR